MIKLIVEDQFYEMAKLTSRYADESLCGDFGEFIYFSPCLDSHGPRVKFYGGTKETSTTRNAPSLSFTNKGETGLVLADWMNKKNCPNAFDQKYVDKVDSFVQKTLPLLLLVWYGKLDEADTLEFFKGNISLKELLSYCTDIESKHLNNIKKFTTLKNLHEYCLANNLYAF